VTGLGAQPLAFFLDEVARSTPAPAGGTSAACAGALAAALLEMAACLTLGRQGDSGKARDAAAQAATLRWRLMELAERELSSYEPVQEALRLPQGDPSRAPRLEAALLEASRPPLAIAQAAAELAELGVAVARASSPSVRADALAGMLLAEAAAAAAASLVEINMGQQASENLCEQAREARARATRSRERVEALVS
jgi:formiminotetrahydrofolate cyclodeaminase